MQKPNRSTYSAVELLDWATSKSLILTPKFQRRSVWLTPARSFFIDTLLRGMPVPPIYIRLTQSDTKTKVVREVIDGQQRVTTIISFMRDEFALSKSLTASWKGKKFSQLSPDEQDEIRNYSFNAESFQGVSDAQVLEIFSRLNTYSVPLSKQELRNGKYFGHFKQIAYSLAYEHLEFWRSNKIVAERGIARMEEVELVSELLAASLDGIQNGKKNLDGFYVKYDETFPQKDEVVKRFRIVLAEIVESIGNVGITEFNRKPLFYSLYCAIYHFKYGLPKITLKRPAKADAPISEKRREQIFEAVMYFSDSIDAFEDGDKIENSMTDFLNSTTRHTDDLLPRQTRLKILYEAMFS